MVITLYFFMIGLFLGSFLNVLADRLPREETIFGRSKCESCGHQLSWKDLVPVLSYLFLRGKCRYCKKRFSIEYLFVEIATGLIFALTYYLSAQQFYTIFEAITLLFIVSAWIVMILSDLRYFILPDSMQVMSLLGALIYTVQIRPSWTFQFDYSTSASFIISLTNNPIISGLLVMLPILFIHIVTKGKGMGFGDVKLAFVLGFLLGPGVGITSLYIGFISGGVVGGFILLMRKAKLKSRIPFGPFLILGGYVCLFYGEYLSILLRSIYF